MNTQTIEDEIVLFNDSLFDIYRRSVGVNLVPFFKEKGDPTIETLIIGMKNNGRVIMKSRLELSKNEGLPELADQVNSYLTNHLPAKDAISAIVYNGDLILVHYCRQEVTRVVGLDEHKEILLALKDRVGL